MTPRQYEPSKKHKWPKGYGSICQRCVSEDHASKLLQTAVFGPTDGARKKLYAVCGEAVFVARREGSAWHGYPVPGSEIPPAVIKLWREETRVDLRTARRLLKQQAIPEHCGCS